MAVEIDIEGKYIIGSDRPDYEGEETEFIILNPIPGGLWHPLYDRTEKKWIEGLSNAEISDRINNEIDLIPQYLTVDQADAIHISYLPMPENSVINAGNLQTAMDQTITSLSAIMAEFASLKASLKPPIFLDSLNDLDNTSLDAHTPNIMFNGLKWVEVVGDWSIVSNQARSNGATGSLAVVDCGVGLKCAVEIDVTLVDSAVPQGVIFRYLNNTSMWRVTYSKSSGGRWILYEISGTNTSIRANVAATNVIFGKTYRFKVLLDNYNIAFYVDDSPIISWTSPTNANINATKIGLYASSSVFTKFKNIKAVNLA